MSKVNGNFSVINKFDGIADNYDLDDDDFKTKMPMAAPRNHDFKKINSIDDGNHLKVQT